MAEIFLPAFISVLTNKATDLIHGYREYHSTWDVSQIRELYQILLAVQGVVEEAVERSRAEPDVNEWVNTLKNAAYEIEKLFDELKYDAIRKVQPYKTTLPDFRMKKAKMEIEFILTEMSKFGFKISRQPMPSVFCWPTSYSYVVDSTIIGRDNDLNKILDQVLGQTKRNTVEVLPIVGMDGIGKTTFAQLIYNSESIQIHFEHTLWVCVNDEFNVAHLAKSIADLVIPYCELIMDNKELLFQRLQAELGGKRYLLVLDDVWNGDNNEWMELKDLLDCGSPGSVVIVTTCHPGVASIVGTMITYWLPGLKNNDLWEIFRLRAFGMGVEQQPKLVEIGMKLMEKCCGSPLVAKTLGGFMSYKKEEREWLDVLESNFMHVENEILPVLKFCYDDLPFHMKWCFAFCVVYPKDYEMERDTLIQLWMANSYIPSERNMEIEEKGIEIFNELVWRGFFQDVKEKDNGIVCKMHYLIHNLVQSIVGKQFASSLNTYQQICRLSPNSQILHMSFISTKYMECFPMSLHTALVLPRWFCRSDWIRFDRMDYLLEAESHRAVSLTETLCRNIYFSRECTMHLSYLDLSYCTNLKVLDLYSPLYSLQTLKLSHCIQLQYLPEEMRKMCNLRHVYLDGCYQLKQMPAGLGELRCLQTLTMYLVNPGIGRGIGELRDLNLGGRLDLYDLSKLANIEDAQQANLVSKRKLIQLYLSWGTVQSDLTESDESNVVKSNPDTAKEILQGLEPNEELEVLEIRQYNGTLFSTWMNDSKALRNLTELTLVECTQCEALPPICQIESLKKLILIRLYSLKHVCSDVSLVPQQGDALQKFAKLEHLSLVDMPNLESWQENDPAKENLAFQFLSQLPQGSLDEVHKTLESLTLKDIASLNSWPKIEAERLSSLAFPKLHELIILRCPMLDALPSCPSLKVLEIAGETIIPSSLIQSFENKGVLVK